MILLNLPPEEHEARRREQRNRASRKYYHANRDLCSARHLRWKTENPELARASDIARKAARVEARALRDTPTLQAEKVARELMWNARRRAKLKNIPFDIEPIDMLPLPTHCPVLGMKLDYGPGRGRKLYENGSAASLDRIHNDKGYVKSNVIVVSLRANLLKGQATIAELQMIADFYAGITK